LEPFKSRQQLIAIDNANSHCQNEKQNRRLSLFVLLQKIYIERAHLNRRFDRTRCDQSDLGQKASRISHLLFSLRIAF
jgi:hypothetical protein